MSFCKLLSVHKSISLPKRPRPQLVIPVSERELFILFKDQSYISYDTLLQEICHEGKLPCNTKSQRHYIGDQQTLILVYNDQLLVHDVKTHSTNKYDVKVQPGFSEMVYFPKLKCVCVTVQQTHSQPTLLVQYWLQDPTKLHKVQLNNYFKQPFLLKTSENSLILVGLAGLKVYFKQYDMLQEECDLAQIRAFDAAIDVKIIVKCFYKEGQIHMFSSSKYQNKLIQHSIASNTTLDCIQLSAYNQTLILSIQQMLGQYVLYCVSPDRMKQFFSVINQNGVEYDQLQTRQVNLHSTRVSMNRSSVFVFNLPNEKWMEKVKEDIPTVIKYRQIKALGKKTLYFRLVKEVFENWGENLWRRVINVIV